MKISALCWGGVHCQSQQSPPPNCHYTRGTEAVRPMYCDQDQFLLALEGKDYLFTCQLKPPSLEWRILFRGMQLGVSTTPTDKLLHVTQIHTEIDRSAPRSSVGWCHFPDIRVKSESPAALAASMAGMGLHTVHSNISRVSLCFKPFQSQ